MNHRTTWGSVLLGLAWCSYDAALFVPAAVFGNDGNAIPDLLMGYEILLYVCYPVFWMFDPIAFFYTLVNVTFWLTPFFVNGRPKVVIIYLACLSVACFAATAAWMLTVRVGVGYWMWMLSYPMAIAGLVLLVGKEPAEVYARNPKNIY
ncbi:hypothetical protein [Symmachiella dynata]|uniref:hypothetical protein n=1 Tax=Symmachiella dynata TaxID=2527995 RepID=UPI0030ED5350